MRTPHSGRAPRVRGSLRRRSGYLYVAVMMVSLIVSIVGITALQVAHNGLRQSMHQSDFDEATLLARSAVEFGKNHVDRDAAWRSNNSHDVESAEYAVGRGTISWRLHDEDGDLDDDATDSVWVVGTGRVGDAVVVHQARLIPNGAALGCLGASVCSHDTLTLGAFTALYTDQIIHSNGRVDADALFSQISGDATAERTVEGEVTGEATGGVAARSMPGSDVFDYYLDVGGRIDVALLPGYSSNAPRLEKTLVAPTVNPYGGVNAEGIYVVDCLGLPLTIQDCRIVGTLVLLNPGSGTKVDGEVCWDAAVPNYPALLVSGDVRLQHDSASHSLSESSIEKNLNPAGVPYQGSADSDTSDGYPSRIRGLVYSSGTLTYPAFHPASRVVGVVVADDVAASSSAVFFYPNVYVNHPPPGFRDSTSMALSPGSWARKAAP